MTQRQNMLFLVLLYWLYNINPALCCVNSLEIFHQAKPKYATFELRADAGQNIKTTVELVASEILTDVNTGSLELFEEVNEAQNTLVNYQKVKYKLVFPITALEVGIRSIEKDGQVMCMKDLKKGRTNVTLTHTFHSIAAFYSNSNIQTTQRPTTTTTVLPISLPPAEDPTDLAPDQYISPERIRDYDDYSACGRNNRLQPLVSGGKWIPKDFWPWLTAIFQSSGGDVPRFLCGGTIISTNAVVTAAHCFERPHRPAEYFVAVGKHNLKNLTEGRTLEIDQIIIHPDYKDITTFDADIAVIKPAKRIEFSSSARPACTWPEETHGYHTLLKGEPGTVVGWGQTEKKVFNDFPAEISVPIVSKEVCESYHKQLKSFPLTRGFCGGGLNGKDPCSGDSGSGLLIKYAERWYLRGIVSLKVDTAVCGDKSYTYYTDVAQYKTWIDSIMT